MNLFSRILALVIVLAVGTPGAGAADALKRRENPAWLELAEDLSETRTRSAEESVDAFILGTMSQYNIPGVSACVVKDGEILWTGAYGYANIAASRPVTPNTLFMLASVSKTFTGLALMQLWEDGEFDLNDNVSDYLPFNLYNPHCFTFPLTFRQILSHTSSLDDNWSVMRSTYCEGDSPWLLADYAYAYFYPSGTYYDADENFHTWEPGFRWDYCNHGFVLAGYLVETISGMPFAQYCQEFVFAPLGMDETSWFVADLDTLHMAMPYHYTGSRHLELGHFSYADYPAGALRTSAPQLGRHLIAFGQHGRIGEARVLEEATVDTVTTIHFPFLYSTQGLTWFRDLIAGCQVWRHGGGDQGVSTIASICFEEQLGVVVLTNGEAAIGTHLIERRLYEMNFDADEDGVNDLEDNCPGTVNPDQADFDGDQVGDVCDVCTDTDGDGYGNPGYPVNTCDPDNCPDIPNPGQEDEDSNGIGDVCDECCHGRVGDANGIGGDEPTVGDVSVMIDLLFINQNPELVACMAEADVNQSGGELPVKDDITVGDISTLIDYLFITGSSLGLPDCL